MKIQSSTMIDVSKLGRRSRDGGWHIYSRDDIKLIIESEQYPVVQTVSGESFPVDETGFLCYEYKIYQAGPPPSEDDIERARKVMQSIREVRSKNGAVRRIAFSDIKAGCETNDDFDYIPNGAFIVAASRLGWRITQEAIYGIVSVSRSWWNKFG